MTCPLCRKRPAKRACPALGQEICTVCCATKRLVEIQCTEDCRYLEAAQRHPAAVVKTADRSRRHAADGHASAGSPSSSCSSSSSCSRWCSPTSPRGSAAWPTPMSPSPTGALAGSLETASKGVIFEEATASVVAEGLRRAMKPVHRRNHEERRLPRRARGGHRPPGDGTRRQARGRTHPRRRDASYLDLVGRVFQQRPQPGRRPVRRPPRSL